MERFKILFDRYVAKTATPAERLEFQEMLQQHQYDAELKLLIDVYFGEFVAIAHEPALGPSDKVLQAILSANKRSSQKSIAKLWPRIAAAIAILFTIGAGAIFYANQGNKAITEHYTNDVLPGSVGATLTLSNGKRIVLSEAATGQLAKEAGISISKNANGQIVYETSKQDKTDGNYSNTLSTANGETYQVSLPDGSLVTLNAASSLTYATSPNERGERRVTLTGEAYFEIFKDKMHPFIVKTGTQEVEVLGTHFNVSAYEDEQSIKTTLLEGAVKVRSDNSSRILIPGQQAELTGSTPIKVNEVDTEDEVAWKDGYFVFNNENLESIMLKLARWYDVEIDFRDENVKTEPFGGRMNRFHNVSAALKILEMTGKAHFKIDGRKIIITK